MIYKVSVDDEYNCEDHIEYIEADTAYDAIMKHKRVIKAFDERISFDLCSEILDKEEKESKYLIEVLKYVGVFVYIEKTVIDRETVIAELDSLNAYNDPEAAGAISEDIIMNFLNSLGYSDIVESYQGVKRYYA